MSRNPQTFVTAIAPLPLRNQRKKTRLPHLQRGPPKVCHNRLQAKGRLAISIGDMFCMDQAKKDKDLLLRFSQP